MGLCAETELGLVNTTSSTLPDSSSIVKMVKFSSSKSSPLLKERILQAISTHPRTYLAAFVAVSFFLFATVSSVSRAPSHSGVAVLSDDDHRLFQLNPQHRCTDTDDPTTLASVKAPCRCTNPLVPTARLKANWDKHHQELVNAAKKHSNVDLVMIGDSIIERWNGTRQLGQMLAQEYLPVFDEFFTKEGGGDIDAVALGSSGDVSNNLLWHLQHGLLQKSLAPKVWLILVGTNDLGNGCSKRNALAGILHVAQYLHDQRKGAKIIVHGLMPRNDDYTPEVAIDYSLNQKWKHILWINKELKRFCDLHEEWVYMDASKLFLQRKKGSKTGELEINPSMMLDALHPTVEGYRAWAPLIVETVKKALK
jgi:lysophospholipase L1-like esterase